jgi:tetratricopeptide (TPR) repeat protein
LETARPAGAEGLILNTLINYGLLAHELGFFEEAQANYQEIIHIAEASHKAWMTAAGRANLAYLYTAMGLYESAAENAALAEYTMRNLGDSYFLAVIAWVSALLNREQGDGEIADMWLTEAEQLANKVKDGRTSAHVEYVRGLRFYDAGEWETAEHTLAGVIETRRTIGDRRGTAYAELYTARVLLRRNDISDAIAVWQKSARELALVGDRAGIAFACAVGSEVCKGRGESERMQRLGALNVLLRQKLQFPMPPVEAVGKDKVEDEQLATYVATLSAYPIDELIQQAVQLFEEV